MTYGKLNGIIAERDALRAEIERLRTLCSHAGILSAQDQHNAMMAAKDAEIERLRAAQQGEPVGVVGMDISGVHMMYGTQYLGQKPDAKTAMLFKDLPVGTQLYAAPQQRQTLTLNQINAIWDSIDDPEGNDIEAFARAVEAAHGITGEKQ